MRDESSEKSREATDCFPGRLENTRARQEAHCCHSLIGAVGAIPAVLSSSKPVTRVCTPPPTIPVSAARRCAASMRRLMQYARRQRHGSEARARGHAAGDAPPARVRTPTHLCARSHLTLGSQLLRCS
jgi:hypothetical protein